MEDYLAMISHHLPQLPEESIAGYLERYHAVRFEDKEVTKRQYSAWLAHLTVILRALDQDAVQSPDPVNHAPMVAQEIEIGKKKKKKRAK